MLSISAVVFLLLEYFSYVEPLLICLPTNWTETCTLVYLAPDMSFAPHNQTLPTQLTHNRPTPAIQFIPLLISLGIVAGIGTGTMGPTTSLNDY